MPLHYIVDEDYAKWCHAEAFDLWLSSVWMTHVSDSQGRFEKQRRVHDSHSIAFSDPVAESIADVIVIDDSDSKPVKADGNLNGVSEATPLLIVLQRCLKIHDFVQFYVYTKFLRFCIDWVRICPEHVSVLLREGLQWDAYKLSMQILESLVCLNFRRTSRYPPRLQLTETDLWGLLYAAHHSLLIVGPALLDV